MKLTRNPRCPLNSKTSSCNGVVWVEPKIQGVVGTEKLCRRWGAAVFSQHVHWRWRPIMDLKEVRVTLITCLQLEEWENNMQNLTGCNKTRNLLFSICWDTVYAVTLYRADICVHATVRIYELWSHYAISWKVPGQKKILHNFKGQNKREKIDTKEFG